ncbi:MAG: hypothetical protein ACLGIF_09830 [Actinomycetes bacterium]
MGKAIAKTLAAVLAATAGLLLALDGAEIASIPVRVLVAAIVTSAVLAAVTTIGGAWAEWRRRRLGARRELADVQLSATMWAIVDQVGSGLDFRDLGMAVYAVGRPWWRPWVTRLRRVHGVRASRRPVASNISWRPGKGVIGACVQQGEVVAVDLDQMYAALGDPTEQEWAEVPADVRLGLSYREYRDVRGKYAVVIASPLIDDARTPARVRGCVVLDGPKGRFPDLTTTEVHGLLNSTAQSLLRQVL